MTEDQTSVSNDTQRSNEAGHLAAEETRVSDVPGAPSWPIPAESLAAGGAPPVGMNWSTVASRLGLDYRLLRHEGLIILAGDYFPESGFFIDPESFQAEHVDVGDVALRHGYFLGNLTARDFAEWFPLTERTLPAGLPVVRSERGPLMGLFRTERDAQRAKQAIMQGAVGAGARIEQGPLGVELRVDRPESPSEVASIIAGHHGALILAAGRPVGTAAESGAMSTSPALPAAEADAARAGTGSASDSGAPATEPGGSEEFRAL